MKANSMSQNLENLFACCNLTLKTPKVNTKLNHNGHGSCVDVIFSNCEIGTVSSAVNDHEMVYAVISDD